MTFQWILQRRMTAIGLGLTGLAFCFVTAASGASADKTINRPPALTKIGHTVAPDRTRIVLDMSAPAKYEVRSYGDPDRIAVNLTGVVATRTASGAEIGEGIVRRVRLNRLPWGVQVVFDLRGKAGWSDLHLQSVDGMPDRIVVDVAGAASAGTSAAPEKRAEEASARSSVAAETEKTDGAGDENRENAREFVVAVDAGHGGKDVGTKGKPNLIEKELALDIARRVAREINLKKGFRAFLVRDKDIYLDLVDRTRIAKRKDADIFVSIHLNSAPRKSARGVEVWFISPAGAEAAAKRILSNEDVAAKELGLEEPENGDIMRMLVDVNQQGMMQRSFRLAEEILNATNRPGFPPARSVKQQSFAVLKSVDMPSVLVEAGFLTNSKDAAFVRTTEGREAIAVAVAAGVASYARKYPLPPQEKRNSVVHKVRAGETLWAISRKYNTTVASIRRSNGLDESAVISVGQQLVIRDTHDGH